jgi:hypothetical protein
MGEIEPRWRFVLHTNDSWSWQLLNSEGEVARVSEVCQDLGKLIVDAMKYGFNPNTDVWVVINKSVITRYAPGAEPEIVSTAPTTVR